MRSAQMAQKAQLAPQLAAAAPVPMDPYQQYLQYQMYQQMEMPQAAAPYSPFAVYGPIYRGGKNGTLKKALENQAKALSYLLLSKRPALHPYSTTQWPTIIIHKPVNPQSVKNRQ
ncbi:unnamed protein product [Caenorhabditis nigoni]